MSPSPVLLDDPRFYVSGIPHAMYDELRRSHPVYRNEGPHPFYGVLSHREAARVLQQPAIYSSALKGILIEDTAPELAPVMAAMLPVMDPPAHTDLRNKLLPPLAPTQLTYLRQALEEESDGLVRAAVRDGEVEFVSALAAEVPLRAFALLMGLTRAQIEPLRGPCDAIIQNGINNGADAVQTLCAALDTLIDERVRAPRDDYMSLLASVSTDRPMDRLARNGMLLQIVIGALETARSAIAGFLAALDNDRAQWTMLHETPQLVANAVEESLRFVCPVNYLRRTSTADSRLAGVEIPRGARVVVFIGAANRDPARFEHPHRLVVDRPNARLHLAFGSGAHFCMGSGLARLQLVAFWNSFVRHVADFEVQVGVERRAVVQQNLITRLPVRLVPA
jgi:cholest-4-en-3-one 26-monooxygenase